MSALLVEQPAPVPAVGDLWADLLAELDPDATSANALLRDMRARREQGIARYGTPLQAANGRDFKADAYQELLDGVVYAHGRAVELADRPTAAAIWRSIRNELIRLAFKAAGAP